ncbi:hypothetical protein NUSPORA_02286 [Nucleospora cyclopteri]
MIFFTILLTVLMDGFKLKEVFDIQIFQPDGESPLVTTNEEKKQIIKQILRSQIKQQNPSIEQVNFRDPNERTISDEPKDDYNKIYINSGTEKHNELKNDSLLSNKSIFSLKNVSFNVIKDTKSNLISPVEDLNLNKFIPTTPKLYKLISELYEKLPQNKYKIVGISIYKDSSGKITDLNKKLEFQVKNEQYIDKTENFIGTTLYNDVQSGINGSKMSRNGIFIDKSLSADQEWENNRQIKQLLIDTLNIKSRDDLKLLTDYKIKGNLIQEVIEYNYFPLKEDDLITICICSDNNCNNNCDEVRKAKLKDIL